MYTVHTKWHYSIIGSKNHTRIQILRLFFLFYLLAWLVLRTFPVHLGFPSLLVLLLTDPPTKQNISFSLQKTIRKSHICWKDPSEARMDPPIQEPYLLSWGPLAAISLNLMVDGVLILRSLLSRSLKPLRQVLPSKVEIKQKSFIIVSLSTHLQ